MNLKLKLFKFPIRYSNMKNLLTILLLFLVHFANEQSDRIQCHILDNFDKQFYFLLLNLKKEFIQIPQSWLIECQTIFAFW